MGGYVRERLRALPYVRRYSLGVAILLFTAGAGVVVAEILGDTPWLGWILAAALAAGILLDVAIRAHQRSNPPTPHGAVDRERVRGAKRDSASTRAAIIALRHDYPRLAWSDARTLVRLTPARMPDHPRGDPGPSQSQSRSSPSCCSASRARTRRRWCRST